MTAHAPREAASWTLRDLRRAVAAGWAPNWIEESAWWPPSVEFYDQPRTAQGRRLTLVEPCEILRAIDRRVGELGARAPAWLPREDKPGKGDQKAGPAPSGGGAGASNNAGGGAPQEDDHAHLTDAPPTGGSVRPDGTAQAEPPAKPDPALREEGETKPSSHSEGERAPQEGEGTARSGEVGDVGLGDPPTASQQTRGGTEADPRGASPAAPIHAQTQETPGTAGPATAAEVEDGARDNHAGHEVADLRPQPGGVTAIHPANDAAGASGSSFSSDLGAVEVEHANRIEADGLGPCRLHAVASHGGVTATWAGLERTGRELRAARQLGRALDRWLEHLDMGAAGDPTPRIDGGKLVRELVTRRCAVSRARRWEREPGLVVVLIDVSGSCSVAAPGTLAAARDLSDAHPGRVAVIVHSNGHLVEARGVAATWPRPPGTDPYQYVDPAETEAWIARHAGPTLAGALVLGDWDGGDLYQALAQIAPLIWLDSYDARQGPKPARPVLRQGWTAPKLPVVWWQGVQTATAAAQAVTLATGG